MKAFTTTPSKIAMESADQMRELTREGIAAASRPSEYEFTIRVLKFGRVITLGNLSGRHQPDALAKAWKRWPEYIDGRLPQGGFSVIPAKGAK